LLGRLNVFALILFGLFLTMLCSVFFLDFFYIKAWKHLDLQRVILCFGLVGGMVIHVSTFFRRPLLLCDAGNVSWFVPFFLVILGHYLYFDAVTFFPFEGVMFLLYFFVIALNGAFIKRGVGVFDASVAMVYAVVICCGFYALFTLQRYVFIISDGLLPRDFIPWGFANIRFWSHIATWVLPLFPLATLIGPCKSSSLWKISAFLTASIWWWVVILSSAHGTMLSQGAALIFVFFFFGRFAFAWALSFIIQLSGGVVLWLVFSWLIPAIVFDGAVELPGNVMSSTPVRLLMWEEAYVMSLVNFPFGMGGQSWLMHEPLTAPYINRDVRLFGAPHNMYLFWAAEYGWASIVALLLPFGYSVYRLKKMCAGMTGYFKKNNAITVALAASVSAVLVHSFVSSVLLTAPAMLVGLMVLSIYWALILPGSSESYLKRRCRSRFRSSYNSSPHLKMVIGFILVATFWFGLIFTKEVMSYHEAMLNDWECFPEKTKLGPIPRFWQHGYFPNPLEYQCD